MKICIIGGGHSGWWTAAYFEKNLDNVEITLYETEKIPVIGVGESCIPQIKRFFDNLDLPVEVWMGTTAVIKTANNHRGWDYENSMDYLYPFWYDSDKIFDKWMRGEIRDDIYNDHIKNPNEWIEHAYHIDSYENARIVKESTKNVTIINEQLNSLPEGYDLYIDCTGFKSYFSKDLTEMKISKHHIMNRCWASNIQTRPGTNTEYTNSIARDYGWQFEIPLKNRIGTGYVFSDLYLSEEKALEDFKNMLKDDEILQEPRLIKWKPKVLKNPWTDNVVSIGAAAGFVDPLESTTLFMTQCGIEQLVECLKRNKSQRIYNKQMNNIWNDALDFIISEYVLSHRRHTPFWKSFEESRDEYNEKLWNYYKYRTSEMKYIFPSGLWATLAYYYKNFNHWSERNDNIEKF